MCIKYWTLNAWVIGTRRINFYPASHVNGTCVGFDETPTELISQSCRPWHQKEEALFKTMVLYCRKNMKTKQKIWTRHIFFKNMDIRCINHQIKKRSKTKKMIWLLWDIAAGCCGEKLGHLKFSTLTLEQAEVPALMTCKEWGNR